MAEPCFLKGVTFLILCAASLPHKVVYLNDYEVATVNRERFEVRNLDAGTMPPRISKLEFSAEDAARGVFPHFMLKEIFEQPRAMENALRGGVDVETAS